MYWTPSKQRPLEHGPHQYDLNYDPRLGVWSIEATYSKDFDTQAIAVFQVKEYGSIPDTYCHAWKRGKKITVH